MFVTDRRFAKEVVSIPSVRVNVPVTVTGFERVTPVLVLLMVRLRAPVSPFPVSWATAPL